MECRSISLYIEESQVVWEVLGLELWKLALREEPAGAVCALAKLGTKCWFELAVLRILSLLSIVRSSARERYLRIRGGMLLRPLNSGLFFLLALFPVKLIIDIGHGGGSFFMVLAFEDHVKALISASTSCFSCRRRLHSPVAEVGW